MDGVVTGSHCVPSSPTDDAGDGDKNDNSNPQQGTGGFRFEMYEKSVEVKKEFVSSSTGDASQRSPIKIPPTAKDSRKLFVGGLPADITDEEFRTFFTAFGEVLDSVVMFDRDTGRSRGFGFVTFKDPLICQKLLSMGTDATPGSCDASSVTDRGAQKPSKSRSGRVEMRGKLIEIKSAEPKQRTGGIRSVPRNHTVPFQPSGLPNAPATYGAGLQLPYVDPTWGVAHTQMDSYAQNIEQNQYNYYATQRYNNPMYYPPEMSYTNSQLQYTLPTTLDPNFIAVGNEFNAYPYTVIQDPGNYDPSNQSLYYHGYLPTTTGSSAPNMMMPTMPMTVPNSTPFHIPGTTTLKSDMPTSGVNITTSGQGNLRHSR